MSRTTRTPLEIWLESSTFRGNYSDTSYEHRRLWAQETLGLLRSGVLSSSQMCSPASSDAVIESVLAGTALARSYQINDEKYFGGWETPIVEWPDFQLADYLLNKGANPWLRRPPNRHGNQEKSTPELLSDLRWPEMLSQVLSHSSAPSPAELDIPGKWSSQQSPGRGLVLSSALANRQVDCAKVLLDYGCSPNAKDEKGRTALFYATTATQAALLFHYGATTEHVDVDGLNALQYWNKTMLVGAVGELRREWQKHATAAASVDEKMASLSSSILLDTKGRLSQSLSSVQLKGQEKASDGTTLLRAAFEKTRAMMTSETKFYQYNSRSVSPTAIRFLLEQCPPETDLLSVNLLASALVLFPAVKLPPLGRQLLEKHFAALDDVQKDNVWRTATCLPIHPAQEVTYSDLALALLWDSSKPFWRPWALRPESSRLASEMLTTIFTNQKKVVDPSLVYSMTQNHDWAQWFQGDPWLLALGLLPTVPAPSRVAAIRESDCDQYGLRSTLRLHELFHTLLKAGHVPQAATLDRYRSRLEKYVIKPAWNTLESFSPRFIAHLENMVLSQASLASSLPEPSRPRARL